MSAEKVRKNLTAKEARQLTDTSFAILNDVYKCIRESACYNKTQYVYLFEDTSEVVIKNIVEDLRKNGYSVQYCSYTAGGSRNFSEDFQYVSELDIQEVEIIIKW